LSACRTRTPEVSSESEAFRDRFGYDAVFFLVLVDTKYGHQRLVKSTTSSRRRFGRPTLNCASKIPLWEDLPSRVTQIPVQCYRRYWPPACQLCCILELNPGSKPLRMFQ
jgi:hypothetical protein